MDSALDILELDELIVLAKLDLQADNLSDALIKLKLADLKGADGEVTIMLARLYARLSLFDKSIPLFSKILQNNPDALIEKFQYGMTYFDNNELSKALEIFDSILAAEPNHPPAMFYSTLILSEQGKVGEAIVGLENILTSVDPKNLFYNRALEQLGKLDSNKALKFPLSVNNANNSHEDVVLN